jgi:hypothetical protein
MRTTARPFLWLALSRLTKAQAKNPIHLRLTPQDTGLDGESTALTDHARFIDRTGLRGAATVCQQPLAMASLNWHLSRMFGLKRATAHSLLLTIVVLAPIFDRFGEFPRRLAPITVSTLEAGEWVRLVTIRAASNVLGCELR